MKKQPYRPSVVVAATVLIVVTSLLLVEGLARLASSNEVLVARIAGAILSRKSVV